MNALSRDRNAAREGAKAELDRINRDLDRLVQALLDGTPARTVKDRMAQVEARKDVLEAHLAQGEDVKVAMHPSMAGRYRERVANLRAALTDEKRKAEAAEIMRTLIDKVELTPVCREGKETLSITLHGDLAGILGLAAKAKGPLGRATLWWSAQNWLRGQAR
jgi:site-specific DNA recombinase